MPGIEAAAPVGQEVLKYLWDFSDTDKETRWKAIQGLVATCLAAQGDSLTPCSISDLHPIVVYSLNRLIRGLISRMPIVKETSAVGLVALLSRATHIEPTQVLALIETHLPLDQHGLTIQRREELYSGRAVAYAACSKMHYHTRSTEILIQMSIGLTRAMTVPSLREMCSITLSNALLECTASSVQSAIESCPDLHRRLITSTVDAEAADILLCLKLWGVLSKDVLSRCNVLPHVIHQPDLYWFTNICHCRHISEAFFEDGHLASVSEALRFTASCQPRLHAIWEILLPLLLCDIDRDSTTATESKIESFWKNIVEPLGMGSTKEQSLALTLTRRVLPHMTAIYIPMIVKGKFWECLTRNVHSNKELIKEDAMMCLEEIMNAIKQSSNSEGWMAIMLICKTPQTVKFKSLRRSLLQDSTQEHAAVYVKDLMRSFLGMKTKRATVSNEPKEILRDLRTISKFHLLDSKTANDVVKFLVCTGLFVVEQSPLKDKELRQIQKSKRDIDADLRRRCCSCCMHVLIALDASRAAEDHIVDISLLGKALQCLSLDGVAMARHLSVQEEGHVSILEDLSEYLATLVEQTEDPMVVKKIKAIHDLLSVIRFYFYAAEETINGIIVEDIARVVAMLFGSVTVETDIEEDIPSGITDDHLVEAKTEEVSDADGMDVEMAETEEHFMDVLTSIVIDLCVRRTDPFSVRLMMIHVRSAFFVFSQELHLSSWLSLLDALITPEAFEVERDVKMNDIEIEELPDIKDEDGQEPSDIEIEEVREVKDEPGLLSDDTSLLNRSFMTDHLGYPPGEAMENDDEHEKQLDRDLDCACSRVLSLIESVIKKRPKSEIMLMTPVYLLKAVLIREDVEGQTSIMDRCLKALDAALQCKPTDLPTEDIPIMQQRISEFLKEIPKNTVYRERIARVIAFLINRICIMESGIPLAMEILRDVLSDSFGRRVPIVASTDVTALLSQHRSLSRMLLPYIISCGRKTHRTAPKLRALMFLNTCLRDRDKAAVQLLLNETDVGLFLMELIEQPCGGRMQLEMLQEVGKAVRVIKHLDCHADFLPKDRLVTIVRARTPSTGKRMLQKRWHRLLQDLNGT